MIVFLKLGSKAVVCTTTRIYTNQLLLAKSRSYLRPALHRAQTCRLISNIFSDWSTNSILHIVQMSRIFADSKTFVDMKMKHNPEMVRREFNEMMIQYEQNPPKEVIAEFVNANFTLGDQMETHSPQDWISNPKFVQQICDPLYQKFAVDLNGVWKTLSRKISDDVCREPDLYSLIYLPHPVIVPGGRFREIYYWDSFWIIRGLLLCEMFETVRGMLLNFAHMIHRFGKIPNGGRTYFINRSQPPLFVQMVDEYVKATGDLDFVRDNMTYMEQEFEYWMREHLVEVRKGDRDYRLARFNCEDAGPRPESYFEDLELSLEHSTSVEERAAIYLEMKTGAETGWDYSSRWFINKDGEHCGDSCGLADTKARFIIPVDLNAFIAKNAKVLANYAREVFDEEVKAERYETISNEFVEAMEAVLWDDVDGIWYDYDLLNHRLRKFFTPSNLVPLWTESFTKESDNALRAVQYLESQSLDLFPGGIPTTFVTSGQQWDFPNCWPPLEHMIVQGLEKTGLQEAKELAFRIAEKRVQGAFNNFFTKGHMFEKYEASSSSTIGGGGEYEIQIGFGWSNGVVLDFLHMYGDRLIAPIQKGTTDNKVQDAIKEAQEELIENVEQKIKECLAVEEALEILDNNPMNIIHNYDTNGPNKAGDNGIPATNIVIVQKGEAADNDNRNDRLNRSMSTSQESLMSIRSDG